MEVNEGLEMVFEFHEKFNRPIKHTPAIPPEVECELRVDLLQEELNELKEAINYGNLKECLDALVDIQYILNGTVIQFGFTYLFDSALREVHRSNMTKLDKNGKAILREDGKVLKSELYEPPNLQRILDKHLPDSVEKDIAELKATLPPETKHPGKGNTTRTE